MVKNLKVPNRDMGVPRRTSCRAAQAGPPPVGAALRVRLRLHLTAVGTGDSGREHPARTKRGGSRWCRTAQKVEMKPMVHIRAKALGALVAVLALGAVAVPSSAVAFHEGCEANLICYYNQTTFGSRAASSVLCSASGAVTTFQSRESARNRCGNKTAWLRTSGTAIACMNPGGDRPSPGTFNEIFVAANYGAFC